MAKQNTFQCSVVTPERQVLECNAQFVAFAAHDGEMGVLIDRAPMVCRLGIGVARFETNNEVKRLYIDGGFAQMVGNRLTLLTRQAREVEDISRTDAQKALTDAQAMPTLSDAEFDARQSAVKRAQVQLGVSSK